MSGLIQPRRDLLKQGASAPADLLAWSARLPGRAQAPGYHLGVLCTGPAGSIPDIVARQVAEQLSAGSARRAVVENRPGAASQIAVNALKAPASRIAAEPRYWEPVIRAANIRAGS